MVQETLSDKEILFEKNLNTGEIIEMLYLKDVKSFIKQLKEEIWDTLHQDLKTKGIIERVDSQIDKLAGDKLI